MKISKECRNRGKLLILTSITFLSIFGFISATSHLPEIKPRRDSLLPAKVIPDETELHYPTLLPLLYQKDTWVVTTQAEFEAGILNNVSTTASPGDVKLAIITGTVELTPGTGGGTWGSGSTTNGDPYNTNWHDCRAQAVYLASELTSAGLTAGEITEVQLHCR